MKKINYGHIFIIFLIIILIIIVLSKNTINEKLQIYIIKKNNQKQKPHGYIWEKCHNSCYNIFDQARFEICKEKCNNKFLF